MARVDDEPLADLIARLDFDPTGRLGFALDLAKKYRPFVLKHHELMLLAWARKRYTDALVELHFALIAMDRVRDGLRLAAEVVDGLQAHLESRDYSAYKQARDHFEHIDDRIHGSRKNAVKPITEDGTARTRHYGLLAKSMEFGWSDRTIDISDRWPSQFDEYVGQAHSIIEARLRLEASF